MTTGTAIAAARAGAMRRVLEVVGVVAFWIALGIAFHLGANAYLLLGVPLTAAFQWGVRRQPMRALWTREAPPFRLGITGWGLSCILAAYPCYCLVRNLRAKAYGPETLWYAAAAAGAVAAAYALRNCRKATAKDLLFCLGTAGVIGVLIMVLNAAAIGVAHGSFQARLAEGVRSLLLYVPVVFVLEEVSFRGAFDAHVHHPGDRHDYATAFLVSALWGLWHLPIVLGQKPITVLIPGLIGVHCAIGVPLSIYWRRSGNLIVPGATHAIVDAVRNALFVLTHL